MTNSPVDRSRQNYGHFPQNKAIWVKFGYSFMKKTGNFCQNFKVVPFLAIFWQREKKTV
jgi:hypothetical protein